MTSSSARTRGRRPQRRPRPSITLTQVLAACLVLALFAAGLWVGGFGGGVTIAALALVGAGLLVLRWPLLDSKIRIFRAGAVLVTALVSLSLFLR